MIVLQIHANRESLLYESINTLYIPIEFGKIWELWDPLIIFWLGYNGPPLNKTKISKSVHFTLSEIYNIFVITEIKQTLKLISTDFKKHN